MTLVVKLGSSIVAADDGELRVDVLDSVCAQVAALEQGGRAGGDGHLGGDRAGDAADGAAGSRPRAMDELQAASAVGQGDLFRAYESRLAGHGTRAAQVLLTAADIAARTNYLNARQTLRRLIEWGVVPVVNENDTTATDEISFGDNDFLAAQVAILLDARLLVLLTDVDGLHSADPGLDPEAELIAEVDDFAELEGLEIGDRTSAFGSGGMRSKVAAAEMASEAGIPAAICNGTRPGTLRAAAAGEAVGTRFAAQDREGVELQALAQVREAGPGPADRRRRARRGCCASAGRACCRSGSSAVEGELRGRRRGRGRRRRLGGRQGDRRLLGGRAGAGDRDEERRGARAAAACGRRGDPSRSLRASLA